MALSDERGLAGAVARARPALTRVCTTNCCCRQGQRWQQGSSAVSAAGSCTVSCTARSRRRVVARHPEESAARSHDGPTACLAAWQCGRARREASQSSGFRTSDATRQLLSRQAVAYGTAGLDSARSLGARTPGGERAARWHGQRHWSGKQSKQPRALHLTDIKHTGKHVFHPRQRNHVNSDARPLWASGELMLQLRGV
jgi:hypothetical protein